MPLVPIPINQGSFKNADSFEIGQGAAELKNLLINDAGSNVSRPSLTEFATIGSSPVIGLTFFDDQLFAVAENRQMYAISSEGIVTNVADAALEGTARPVFANDGTYLAIAGGGAPKRWDGGTATEDMPGSPVDCTHVIYLDGYWINFLLDDQELRFAGPTSVLRATWNSSDFFQAEGLPDNIQAIAVLNRELYAFGSDSTETFFNYGDSSNPFKRTFFIDRGLGAKYSLVQADNTLWYLDSDRRFVQLQGRNPVTISTPYDRIIRGYSTVSDCWGTVIERDSHYLIVWTFPTVEKTVVFDYKNQYWSEWDTFIDGVASRMTMHSAVHAKGWNKFFVGDPSDGTIWELSKTSHADGVYPRRLLRRTGQIDHGTGNRKRSNYYLFDVKRAVGTGSSTPIMEVRVNDDGQGWSEPEQVELGITGEAQQPIRIDMRGIYRKRQIEVTVTDSVEFVLHSIQEDVEVMTS